MSEQSEMVLPPECLLSKAQKDAPFRHVTPGAGLWYEPGTTARDVLIASFDNLATLDHPYPRQPWIAHHIRALGYSLLGVQSMKKDWFRRDDAPDMLAALAAEGFFEGFSRVVFVGASMGAFGALNFAPLVRGADVIALSPQSTMNSQIAPFESRFPWAVRNSEWTTPAFLDAAAAVPYIPRVWLLYDPFVPEDKLHAERLTRSNVVLAPLRHASHEAVRVVIKSGALATLLTDVAEHNALSQQFWSAMRNRRNVRKWGRSFMSDVQAAGHPKRTLRAANALIAQDNYLFASRARTAILNQHPELEPLSGSK